MREKPIRAIPAAADLDPSETGKSSGFEAGLLSVKVCGTEERRE